MAKIPGTVSAYDSRTNVNLNTYRASGMPEIGDRNLAITTTNISVFANGQKVGFVQSLSPSESRNITAVQALGEEGVVQMVPGNTTGGQISMTRFAVYNSNIFNALGLTRTGTFVPPVGINATNASSLDATYRTYGNPFKTLKDQRVPFEIQVKTRIPTQDGSEQFFIETYLDCWITSYSKTIASNTITISEQVTASYSDVITNRD